MARLAQDGSPTLGRGHFYALCLLQREDLETMEDGKEVEETAQRTGKVKNNKEKRLVREEKIRESPNTGGSGRNSGESRGGR